MKMRGPEKHSATYSIVWIRIVGVEYKGEKDNGVVWDEASEKSIGGGGGGCTGL